MSTIQTRQCVFLSPHLDDAVLSCGGLIYQLAHAGRATQVITIFAGDPPPGPLTPFAHSLHDRWAAEPAARRDEDIRALRMLGAEAIHWPYPDAVYRRDPVTGTAWYDSEESIFGEMASADNTTVESIADRLKAVDSCARLIVPLTAGHHVDHLVVGAAAESLRRELVYYEDYPYAERPERLEPILREGSWTPDLVRLDDEAIRRKARAILAYRSQISTFFRTDDEVEQRVRVYANRVGGEAGPAERLWRRG
jgi:LmbE family N-acetylglucosaminyl deacetylase